MKYLIHIIMILVVAVVATAARAPQRPVPEGVDIDEIRAQVTDRTSPYYYPRLMKQFEANETVMTTADYRYLYLGSMFNEDYNPYRRSVYADTVLPLTFKEKHTRAELDVMIKYCQLALEDTPFDLNQMNFLIYALREKGKVNLANIWQYRMNRLLEAIMSTGSGADTTSAWYVIYPRDEATIVNLRSKKVESLNPTFVEPYYDCLEVTDNQGKQQQYYFNIKTVLEEFNRKYPEM
ncbi:MAG: DUF4919 domain-containing protein [Muribaculaceae bacterium]|nr:DUF4919 domain-containing protein [Muribaculaceae bacterium]